MRFVWLGLWLLFCPVISQAQWLGKLHPDSLLNRNFRFIPAPIVYRSPETSWGIGLSTSYYFNTAGASQKNQTRTSNLQFQFVRTLRQQNIGQFITETFTPNERYYIYTYLGYRDYLDRFYGLGPVTTEADREDYRFKSWISAVHILKNVGNRHFVGLGLRYQQMYDVFVSGDGILAQGLVAGAKGSRLFGIGPEWQQDKRDNPYAPFTGHYINVQFRHHPDWSTDWFSYSTLSGDFRFYKYLGKEAVWANRIYYLQQFGQAPFREMAQIGGDNGQRGYFYGRYRDRSLLDWQSEYRFPIWSFIRGVAFVGVGQLGSDPSQYFNHYWRGSYGLGLRLLANKKERITMRIDYGRTLEGQQAIYIEFNEAF